MKWWNKMKLLLVGLVSTPEQAKELENITKLFLVGIRARKLAHKIKE